VPKDLPPRGIFFDYIGMAMIRKNAKFLVDTVGMSTRQPLRSPFCVSVRDATGLVNLPRSDHSNRVSIAVRRGEIESAIVREVRSKAERCVHVWVDV
jgi:hypothetical protein